MNIEESLIELKNYIKDKTNPYFDNYGFATVRAKQIQAIETLLTAYEKEKEKNKRAEELYMQHNQMIIDILKECDYMIENSYCMNDIAIRNSAENIKNIAKYYIKEPEWIKLKEE